MKHYERITVNPEIMFGKPVIKGTRVTVEQILHKLANEMTPEEIIKDHPHLKQEDIRDAQYFSADYLSNEDIMFTHKA